MANGNNDEEKDSFEIVNPKGEVETHPMKQGFINHAFSNPYGKVGATKEDQKHFEAVQAKRKRLGGENYDPN